MHRGIAVAELDLDGLPGDVLSFRPAPGGPPVTGGEVYALIRLHGRPVGTILTHVPPDEDAAKFLAQAASTQLTAPAAPSGRARDALAPPAGPGPAEADPAAGRPDRPRPAGRSPAGGTVGTPPAPESHGAPPAGPAEADCAVGQADRSRWTDGSPAGPSGGARDGLAPPAGHGPAEPGRTAERAGGLPDGRADRRRSADRSPAKGASPTSGGQGSPPAGHGPAESDRAAGRAESRSPGGMAARIRRSGRSRAGGPPASRTAGHSSAGGPPVRAGAAAEGLGAVAAESPGGGAVIRGAGRVSVVVATRERSAQLRRALDSLLRQDHPGFEIVVVDNAPVTTATRDLVATDYASRVRYVREPVPGLAAAHNRGVAAARGEVLAFTDDDVVADPHWLTALTAPFAADPGLGCVTGLILPAQLRTPAQVLLESHGGFAKGFAARTYDPRRPPADEPLFPFTAGSFGSGANMAFRADALRAVGGFDPATGTGTPARGGDDLYAFVRILAAGHRLRYTPEALVWHHHRETWQDLENQAYGYGAGLTAYLTAVLVRRPALLPALLARLPRGLAHARAITAYREAGGAPDRAPGEHGGQTYPWPRGLSRLERRGMLYGPVGYLRARRRVRRIPLPWQES